MDDTMKMLLENISDGVKDLKDDLRKNTDKSDMRFNKIDVQLTELNLKIDTVKDTYVTKEDCASNHSNKDLNNEFSLKKTTLICTTISSIVATIAAIFGVSVA
jgi:hypothetical protein